ncbi:hypothetical protein [Nocardia sp. NPDC052112]|uniref:hypothetical protein n=1 Tax=Nocardia sp. NPDC052112 TaxID=3155646 RepID=UPI003438CA41
MHIAMLDRELARATKGFADAVESPDASSIRSRVERVFAVVDNDPATWRMFMMPSEGGPPELYERLSWARTMALDCLVGLVRANTAPSDRADTELTARTLHAAYDEFVRLRLRDPDTYSIERLAAHAERITEAILGVGPVGATTKRERESRTIATVSTPGVELTLPQCATIRSGGGRGGQKVARVAIAAKLLTTKTGRHVAV